MLTTAAIVILASGAAPSSSDRAAEAHPRPSDAVLDEIVSRGKALAKQDDAVRMAREALQELTGGKAIPAGTYIPDNGSGRWKVFFGSVPGDETDFFSVYEADEVPGNKYRVEAFSPPRREPGWPTKAFKALELARQHFPGSPRIKTYNHALVPEANGDVSVYLFADTADLQSDAFGADARVLVRSGGTVEVTPYHKNLMRVRYNIPDDVDAVASSHSHTEDLPNPIDVLWVLTRPTRLGEIIMGPHWTFVLKKNGRVGGVTPTTDLHGSKSEGEKK